jgi:4a-hydroxytetrahydrobiopterin dehydratase
MKRLDDNAITAALTRLPGWRRVGDALEKTFELPTFPAAIAFVGAVADISEAHDHHPDILVRYRRVTLTLCTHDAGHHLTELDLDVATAVERLPTLVN